MSGSKGFNRGFGAGMPDGDPLVGPLPDSVDPRPPVQPGEAGIEAAWKALGQPTGELDRVRRAIAAYLSADPASALRAVLQHPEAREALRGMLTSEASIEAAMQVLVVGRPTVQLVIADYIAAAVDALASGVEGDRDA